MPYPFCNSTKELEDTEAPDAFSLYLLENEKMLNFLFEIIMRLFQRITSSKGEKKKSCRTEKHFTLPKPDFIPQYHHSDCNVGSCVLLVSFSLSTRAIHLSLILCISCSGSEIQSFPQQFLFPLGRNI